MQIVLLDRVADVLPRVQPQAVAKEEAERKEEARAAQASAGVTNTSTKKTASKQAPVQKEHQYSRNDLVTITNGETTQELKFKKAQELLDQGWTIVKK